MVLYKTKFSFRESYFRIYGRKFSFMTTRERSRKTISDAQGGGGYSHFFPHT